MTLPTNPLSYEGIKQRRPPNITFIDHDPLSTYYIGFDAGDLVQNNTTYVWWMLVKKAAGVSTWRRLITLNGVILTLTTDDGTIVVPDINGNVNLAGDSATGTLTSGSGSTATVHNVLASDAEAIAGSATNKLIVPSSLTAKLGTQTSHGGAYGATTSGAVGWTAGLTDGQLMIGSSIGVPASANITSLDGTIIVTNGHNSLDLSATGTGRQEVDSLTTDDAVVVKPDTNGNINLAGNTSEGVNTTGNAGTFTATVNVNHASGAQTIAGSATNLLVDPAGLTAKLGTQTANSVPYGQGNTSAVGWTGAMTDGQIPIGSSTGVPAAANITSTDGTVTITNGHNSINLSAGGGLIFEEFTTAISTNTIARTWTFANNTAIYIKAIAMNVQGSGNGLDSIIEAVGSNTVGNNYRLWINNSTFSSSPANVMIDDPSQASIVLKGSSSIVGGPYNVHFLVWWKTWTQT